MAFESFAEFLQMGRHGVYVWSTYGISGVALIGLGWLTVREHKQVKQQLRKRYQREQSR